MAKIGSVRKIVVEDYETESRPLVQRLAQTLNSFLEQAATAINGQLTLRENSKGKVFQVDLPADVSTRTLAWTINEKPVSVTIGALTLSTGDAPADPFSLSWKYTSSGLSLTFLGLDNTKHHVATIVAQV